jgi:hypothetical protein
MHVAMLCTHKGSGSAGEGQPGGVPAGWGDGVVRERAARLGAGGSCLPISRSKRKPLTLELALRGDVMAALETGGKGPELKGKHGEAALR